MEEYLPLIFIAAAIVFNLFKGKKEEEDEEQTPQTPTFPPVFPTGKPEKTQPRRAYPPVMETKPAAPHPQTTASRERKAEYNEKKGRPHEIKAAESYEKKEKPVLHGKSMPMHVAPHASTLSQGTKKNKKGITATLPPVEESGSSISLSTPEEAKRAFLSAEIFQRKY